MKNLILIVGLLSFYLLPTNVIASPSAVETQNFASLQMQNQIGFDANEIVVKYKNGQQETIQTTENIWQKIVEIKKDSKVFSAEPNFKYYQSAIYAPNDLDFSKQDYLKQIYIEDAWKITNGSKDIVIAVIDAGIDLKHPDLANKIWINADEIPDDGLDNDKNGYVDDYYGWNYVEDDNNTAPDFSTYYTEAGVSHGTLVAGIAGADTDNAFGISGVGFNTKIMSLRALDSWGEGDLDDIGLAVQYAVANGADILNLSFVGPYSSKLLKQSIIEAYNKGVVVVAAAGNTSDEEGGQNLDEYPLYPICDDFQGANMVIGVASVDKDGKKSLFSNYGTTCVDISAPGENFHTLSPYYPEEGYNTFFSDDWSGTSLSSPVVAGVAALIKAVNPGFSNDQIGSFLINSTPDGINQANPNYNGMLGSGVLNAGLAVTQASESEAVPKAGPNLFIVGVGSSFVKTYDYDGNNISNFQAFPEIINPSIFAVLGDVNNDSQNEIVASYEGGFGVDGKPRTPVVKIFDFSGNLLSQFLAYDSKFTGGVKVALADTDNDSNLEIITAPGYGGGPHVRVFDSQGIVKNQFFAYDKTYRGGLSISSGDVNGDLTPEIIVGLGVNAKPKVRVFDSANNLISEFSAYGDTFTRGINVSSGDVNGDFIDEIITGPNKGGGPQIRVFDFKGNVVSQFFSNNSSLRNGVNVGAIDLNSDGLAEILAGASQGEQPYVGIYNMTGVLLKSFLVYEPVNLGGVNVE